jgi:hypothetical protein
LQKDKSVEYMANPEVQALRNKLISQIDKVDKMVQEQILDHIDRLGNCYIPSESWVSCLMRCRADLQTAVAHLLGSCE